MEMQVNFRVNEFGALEVITDEMEMESVKKATATTTWMVPTAQEVFSEKTEISPKLKETAKVGGNNFCENCSHSGSVEEFIAGENICSQKCCHQIKNREQKEDKEVSELNGEDYSKGTEKRKAKSPPKGECVQDREEKKKNEIDEKPEGRILRGSQRATRKRRREMAILKQTLMSKEKKAWSWSSYLEEEKAVAAPPKIFKEVHCPLKS
ncbi:UNVERIFIED_CONTAM: hypothetical protein K2H54_073206 [Gekko kuhli]